jgi:hypothetical protein
MKEPDTTSDMRELFDVRGNKLGTRQHRPYEQLVLIGINQGLMRVVYSEDGIMTVTVECGDDGITLSDAQQDLASHFFGKV